MELKQIRYFLKLADTLNFTEASEQIGITQPALSKAVQKMEEEFGGTLIYRDGKNTRLTDLGKCIRMEMQRISDSEKRAKEVAFQHLNEDYAHIKVGISDSLGPARFTNFIMGFKEKYPHFNITLHPINQTDAYNLILSGQLDCCFCSNIGRDNHKIKVSTLFEERLMVAMAESHPLAKQESITLRDMAQHPYFDRINCEFRLGFSDILNHAGYVLNIALQSDREDWVQHFVSQGHGVCSLPEFSVVADNLCLRTIDGVDLRREIFMVSVFGSANSRAFQKLDKYSESFKWQDSEQFCLA